MITELFDFTGYGETRLPAVQWVPETDIKAVLQITHGMTEHMGRYVSFAEQMTSRGIAVAGFDLRGHGKNPGDPQVASLGKGGWEASIGDMKCFYDLLDFRFPGIPHFLLGFSFGSFLLREYLGCYFDDPAGAIIMGTGYQPPALLSVMAAIVKSQWKKQGFDGTTDLVRKLSFGTYNQKFQPNRTQADWLCGDNLQLDEYLADPLVRKDISSGLFSDLLNSMKRTGSHFAYDHWETHIPILLLSGERDPVGDNGNSIQTIYKRMKKTGIENVTMHLLPEARHDLLHEAASGAAAQAIALIKDWILEVLQ